MTDWRHKLDERFAQVRTETADGQAYSVFLFEGARLGDLIKQGDAGDQHARNVIMAFGDWGKHASEAAADGVSPGCFICNSTIGPGEVAAIAYIQPLEIDDGMAMILVMCPQCYQTHSYEQAMAKVGLCLEQELGADVENIPIQ